MIDKTRHAARALLAAALLVATLSLSAPVQAQTGADDIAQRARDFVTAYNTADDVRIGDFYTDNAVFFPSQNETVIGREAIQELYSTLFSSGAAAQLQFSISEVAVFGQNAIVVGFGTSEFFAGDQRIRQITRSMHYWRLESGDWFLHRQMTNIVARGPVTN